VLLCVVIIVVAAGGFFYITVIAIVRMKISCVSEQKATFSNLKHSLQYEFVVNTNIDMCRNTIYKYFRYYEKIILCPLSSLHQV
jgi:hypothetical protein